MRRNIFFPRRVFPFLRKDLLFDERMPIMCGLKQLLWVQILIWMSDQHSHIRTQKHIVVWSQRTFSLKYCLHRNLEICQAQSLQHVRKCDDSSWANVFIKCLIKFGAIFKSAKTIASFPAIAYRNQLSNSKTISIEAQKQ